MCDPNEPRTGGFHCFDFAADRFNFAPFNLLLTPCERKGVFGQSASTSPTTSACYAKALYNNRNSTNQAAPEPIFVGPGAGTGGYRRHDLHPGQQPVQPVRHRPDRQRPNANFASISRRPLEGGPRIFDQDVDTTTSTSAWTARSASATHASAGTSTRAYSKNKAEQTNLGSYNVAQDRRWRWAIRRSARHAGLHAARPVRRPAP